MARGNERIYSQNVRNYARIYSQNVRNYARNVKKIQNEASLKASIAVVSHLIENFVYISDLENFYFILKRDLIQCFSLIDTIDTMILLMFGNYFSCQYVNQNV